MDLQDKDDEVGRLTAKLRVEIARQRIGTWFALAAAMAVCTVVGSISTHLVLTVGVPWLRSPLQFILWLTLWSVLACGVALPVMHARRAKRAKVFSDLAAHGGPEVAGPLLEALQCGDDRTVPLARDALLTSLCGLKHEDADSLTEPQMWLLLRVAVYGRVGDDAKQVRMTATEDEGRIQLRLAAIAALHAIGDDRAAHAMKWLTTAQRQDPRVRAAAVACLPDLEVRAEKARDQRLMLRPSSADDAAAATALRPADAEAARLDTYVRPSDKDDGQPV